MFLMFLPQKNYVMNVWFAGNNGSIKRALGWLQMTGA